MGGCCKISRLVVLFHETRTCATTNNTWKVAAEENVKWCTKNYQEVLQVPSSQRVRDIFYSAPQRTGIQLPAECAVKLGRSSGNSHAIPGPVQELLLRVTLPVATLLPQSFAVRVSSKVSLPCGRLAG